MGPVLPSLLLAIALGGEPVGPVAPFSIDLSRLRTGLPAVEVVQILGPPKRVARQILYKRCMEQWIYETPYPLRIEFDCVQGRQSQILTVRPIISYRP
jgi:hypothetical protein